MLKVGPALAFLVGSFFYAFPKATKVVKKLGKTAFSAVGSALTIVEWATELPGTAWAISFLVLGVLYLLHSLIGLGVVWSWLSDDGDVSRRRRARE